MTYKENLKDIVVIILGVVIMFFLLNIWQYSSIGYTK